MTEEQHDQGRMVHPEGQDEFDEIKKHLKSILLSVLAALVVVGGFFYWRNQEATKVKQASELLLQAGRLEDLQKISTEYSKTPSAPFALLAEGSGHFNSGRYQQALDAFEKLVAAYPDHPATEIAEYLHALSQEASGSLTAALSAFEAFTAENPEHYLYAPAVFGKARCLVQLGRMQEASNLYEEFIAGHPENPWISEAEFSKAETDRMIRHLASAPPPAASASDQIQIPFAPPGQ